MCVYVCAHSGVSSFQHVLRCDRVPSYIPTRVAEKILFIGNAVQVLRAASSSRASESKAGLCVFLFVLVFLLSLCV